MLCSLRRQHKELQCGCVNERCTHNTRLANVADCPLTAKTPPHRLPPSDTTCQRMHPQHPLGADGSL